MTAKMEMMVSYRDSWAEFKRVNEVIYSYAASCCVQLHLAILVEHQFVVIKVKCKSNCGGFGPGGVRSEFMTREGCLFESLNPHSPYFVNFVVFVAFILLHSDPSKGSSLSGLFYRKFWILTSLYSGGVLGADSSLFKTLSDNFEIKYDLQINIWRQCRQFP